MKKSIYYSFVLCTLSLCTLLTGCAKKPAQQNEQQEQPQENEQMVNDQTVNYQDITALTPDGAELSLSDLIGQTDYVLLDFWASWCGPCRRFVPVLKEIYASQPAGHLQILSCSVDQDIMAWQVALNEEQMPWPQMREDADHPCSDKYNVQFIPHTVLFDREGKIVAVNPEEPDLEEILLGE
jgi:thiol-disulfide isomerase/thioredoxin